MLLVAISWIYILLTAIALGIAVSKALGIGEKIVETSFLGLFATSLLACVWAFFGRINVEFQLFHFALSAVSFYRYRRDFRAIITAAGDRISRFPDSLKLVFWVTLAIILAQSAAPPFVLDNESYYIQTVKWLNQYGLVKGLANLHVLFAQCSGWHIAQSAFSFSFVYGKFNDLSGLCLLLGNVYGFFALDDFLKSGDPVALIAGLLPLLNLFLLRFSGAPSPDVPVYIITFVIADHFIKNFKNPDPGGFNLIWLLVLFVVFCKTSAVSLVLLPLFLISQGRWKLLQFKTLAIALFVLALFLAKNSILSGYPLHPLPGIAIGAEYDLPQNLADFYYIETKIYGYELIQADYNATNTLGLLIRWATLGHLHGLFNQITIALLIAAPFFILRTRYKKPLWLLYFAMVAQLALLLCGSPQYRYYINFTLFFGLFCLSTLPLNRKMLVGGFAASAVACAVLLLFPIGLDSLSKNENTKETLAFSAENLIFPYQNSKLSVSYQTVQKGNLRYNSPVNSPFFWATGDGELPCVNQAQLDYIEKYYRCVPQQRTNNPGDGFYSKR